MRRDDDEPPIGTYQRLLLPKEAHKATWALPNSSVLVDPMCSDFAERCKIKGDYAIADCLKANTRRLSSACRRVIEPGSR
jgi:hypothetical protein